MKVVGKNKLKSLSNILGCRQIVSFLRSNTLYLTYQNVIYINHYANEYVKHSFAMMHFVSSPLKA